MRTLKSHKVEMSIHVNKHLSKIMLTPLKVDICTYMTYMNCWTLYLKMPSLLSLGKGLGTNWKFTQTWGLWTFDMEARLMAFLKITTKFSSKLNPREWCLKVVSATFLLVCFLCLKGSTSETRKNVFYFISKALFVFEIIRF